MQQQANRDPRGPAGETPRRAPVDFIVIGAMRAGTTLLQDILSQHPQIAMARMKETDFFIEEKTYSRGEAWYAGQFDPDLPIRGEISPNYAKARDFPGVPARIRRHCPDVRLIYLLRDPVVRAVSQYSHSWNMGELSETPEQMAGAPDAPGHEYLSILDCSSYARQLDAYRQHFDPEQILVLDFESLLAEPQRHLDSILRHIGAAPMAMPAMASRNANDELARVPKPLLRLMQGPLRPVLTRTFGPRMRSRLRGLLARGPARQAPDFPASLLVRIRADLSEDTARLRRMTGQEFSRWRV